MKNDIVSELSKLIDKPLFDAASAGGMMIFSFGDCVADSSGGSAEIGEFTLHLQSSWRILKEDRIIVGTEDMYYPQNLKSDLDDFDPETEPSLCDAQIEKLFGSNYLPKVVSVEADVYGGFKLTLENIVIEAFPAHSMTGEFSEHWRMVNNRDQTHFVVTGDGVEK